MTTQVEHQPREHSVPCFGCRVDTLALTALCPSCTEKRTPTAIRAQIVGTWTPATLIPARPFERVQPVTTVWVRDTYAGGEYAVEVITDTIRELEVLS